MKKTSEYNVLKQELVCTVSLINSIEKRLQFTNEEKLIDSLSYELLAQRARYGYLLDKLKSQR